MLLENVDNLCSGNMQPSTKGSNVSVIANAAQHPLLTC